ncbi:MAG: LysM peptidoglycan-binding domain-containing protein [Firmicutes bacterium]|nr:LysM peptidoglycan-binding domain-containing protein [Bacillota bacterium]
MSNENNIPDYAMVPAKEISPSELIPITEGLQYDNVQVTNVEIPEPFFFTIEEDILVPDVKPDLSEILLMDGNVSLATREIVHMAKDDEMLTISGDIQLQTLYLPEINQGAYTIISIHNKIPFKDQIKAKPFTTIVLSCEIDKIEFSVINERKYRARITLRLLEKEYSDQKLSIFRGIEGEDIQCLKEMRLISSVASRTKDMLSISEEITPSSDYSPEEILFSRITALENYMQITSDKAIISGFIYVTLLYKIKSSNDDLNCESFQQIKEKVEFTQFIPLHISTEAMGYSPVFDSSNLRLYLDKNEDGRSIFRLEGNLITHIELYNASQVEIISDAYHKERTFKFDINSCESRITVANLTGENSLREIFSPELKDREIQCILFTSSKIIGADTYASQGLLTTEGIIGVNMLCLSADEDAEIIKVSEEFPFRLSMTRSNNDLSDEYVTKVFIKDFWAEKINGKQLEFNASLLANVEIIRTSAFSLITNPGFEGYQSNESSCPIIIYTCRTDDSLWDIAKRFRTTVSSISSINDLEGATIEPNKKLLILR